MGRLTGSLLVLIGGASYGLLSTFAKLAYGEGFTTSQVVSSQAFGGWLFFILTCLPLGKQLLAINWQDRGALLVSGAMSGLTGALYYASLQYLSASYAVILLFQFTWMAMLIDWLYFKQRPTRYQGLALALIVVGTYLAAVASQNTMPEQVNLVGVLLGLLSACSYTLFITFSGHVATKVPTLVRNLWMVTGSLVLVFVIFPPEFLWDGSLQRGLWLWGGLLGAFGILVPFYCFAKGVPVVGAGMAGLLGSVELPMVLVTSHYFLQETLSTNQLFGVVIILLGVALSIYRPQQDKVLLD